jgi:beta-lactamase regulating signal transducer with metallopeptidase domain
MIAFINGLAATWASWALAISWQVAVLAAFVLALDLLVLRRAWPQVRYALWLLVLVRLVTPPGFALWSSVSPRVLTAAADRTPAYVPDW